jgi:hypothetical protein
MKLSTMSKMWWMTFALLWALLCGSQDAHSQATYTANVQNQIVVTGSAFQFDLYVLSGATSWRMADASFWLTFNAGAFSGVAVSYVEGSTDLSAGYTIAPDIVAGNVIDVEIQSPTTYSSATTVSSLGNGTRIGTFQVSTISDFGALMNLDWKTPILSFQVMLQRLSDNSVQDITGESSYPTPSSTPLPIQLASSAANVIRGNDVEVGWKTVSETNNYGFEVDRKRGETGEWTKVGFVQGHGTTLAPQSYSYIDRSLSFGEYFYRIKQIDLDGKSEIFPEMAVTVGAGAEKFVLAQNYPNPFNPSTVIEFVVPVSGHTTLRVYNVLGQEVATLFSGNAEAGKVNAARFDATNLPSGLYFYTLRNAAKTETRRMLLVK